MWPLRERGGWAALSVEAVFWLVIHGAGAPPLLPLPSAAPFAAYNGCGRARCHTATPFTHTTTRYLTHPHLHAPYTPGTATHRPPLRHQTWNIPPVLVLAGQGRPVSAACRRCWCRNVRNSRKARRATPHACLRFLCLPAAATLSCDYSPACGVLKRTKAHGPPTLPAPRDYICTTAEHTTPPAFPVLCLACPRTTAPRI